MLISPVSLLVPKETRLQFASERNNVNCACKVQTTDELFVSSLVPFGRLRTAIFFMNGIRLRIASDYEKS